MLAHVGRRGVEMELEEAMIDVMGPEINDPLTHGAGVCGNKADLVNLGVEWSGSSNTMFAKTIHAGVTEHKQSMCC
jgi:hypothetical protein